ncbi:UNVERIFIED_CONTAM: hypothetical protein HDU68_001259 [Siphonaria sp. JEL0065]|nr:hypothetical protein HDU68_001259 [Siphonaria sp. JEL0065]
MNVFSKTVASIRPFVQSVRAKVPSIASVKEKLGKAASVNMKDSIANATTTSKELKSTVAHQIRSVINSEWIKASGAAAQKAMKPLQSLNQHIPTINTDRIRSSVDPSNIKNAIDRMKDVPSLGVFTERVKDRLAATVKPTSLTPPPSSGVIEPTESTIQQPSTLSTSLNAVRLPFYALKSSIPRLIQFSEKYPMASGFISFVYGALVLKGVQWTGKAARIGLFASTSYFVGKGMAGVARYYSRYPKLTIFSGVVGVGLTVTGLLAYKFTSVRQFIFGVSSTSSVSPVKQGESVHSS